MKKRISNAQRIGIAHTSRRTEDARCKSKEYETKVQKKTKMRKERAQERQRECEREQCVNDMANPANNNNGANNWSPAKHDAAVD